MIIKLDVEIDGENTRPTCELELWEATGTIYLQISDSERVIGVEADELLAAVKTLCDLDSGLRTIR